LRRPVKATRCAGARRAAVTGRLTGRGCHALDQRSRGEITPPCGVPAMHGEAGRHPKASGDTRPLGIATTTLKDRDR
jgi:hypothetical protein